MSEHNCSNHAQDGICLLCGKPWPQGKSELVPTAGSPTEEIKALKAEIERLKDHLRRCNSDWMRLKDFIIAANGPGEMIRFQDAVKKNGGKGVGIFLDYINSLWNELAKAKSEN